VLLAALAAGWALSAIHPLRRSRLILLGTGGLPGISDETWLASVRPHFTGELFVGRDLMEV